MTIWYILLLAINLSGEQGDFNLTIKEGDKMNQYHIYRIVDNIWTVDWPNKNDLTKTIPLNIKVEDKISLTTLLFDSPIILEKLCDCKEIDWEKADALNLHASLQKKGETKILVDRTTNGFTLSQKSGFLNRYEEINVNWKMD